MYTLVAATFICIAAFAINYPGNGKSGFGGATGGGSLDINTDLTSIIIDLNRGAGDFNDILVIYIDSKSSGGFSSTKKLTDAQYELQRAISGFDGGLQRSTFNFSDDFKPDYALAFGVKNGDFPGGAILVKLEKEMPFTFISQPTMNDSLSNTAAKYTVSVTPAQIGLQFASSFKFMATYISSTGYRSDEAIGDPMTDFTSGWNEYTSTTPPLIFDRTLPVVFGNFSGALKGAAADLTWSTKTEINFKQFELQKSNNGSTWVTAATIASKNINTGAQYSFTDRNVTDSKTYYRLKLISQDGSYFYSGIIILRKGAVTNIDLLGNPVKNVINLSISNNDAANYKFELFTVDGRRLAVQNYVHVAGTNNVSVNVPANAKGNCILKVINGSEQQSFKIIVE